MGALKILTVLLLIDSTAASFWDYEATTKSKTCGASDDTRCGTNAWSTVKEWAACGNVGDQSPIDANFKSPTHKVGSAISDLSLTADATQVCAKANLVLSEHTMEVEVASFCPGSYVATLEGKTYNLHQYHYHSPSDHTVDGAYFPLEVHHVHVAADGQYLILAVFMTADKNLEAGCTAATVATVECIRARFFQSLLTATLAFTAPAVDSSKLADVTAAIVAAGTGVREKASGGTMAESLDPGSKSFDPYTNFIPAMDKYFFNYIGSFSTPPCTTGVQYILNPTPVTIFDSSLILYRAMTDAYPTDQLAVAANPWGVVVQPFTWDVKLGVSNRPIQLLGATRAFYYIGTLPPFDSSSSSGTNAHSSDSSISASVSSESDSSNSYGSSGSAAIGSSGFYMAIWKWALLALCLCCSLVGLAAACNKRPVKKKRQPEPYPQENRPLLPPMMPTNMPMTTSIATSYAPSYVQAAPSYMQAPPSYVV